MKEFFAASPGIAWSLVSFMIALVALSFLWNKVIWWWHNTWYSFPLIGKINSLSGDTNRDTTDSSWFKAEKTLCRDYKKFIRIQDEHDFNEKVTYITKAGDNGRKNTPNLIWVLTVALVFVEAMGFSYVLAGYTLPGASENMQQMGAYGIAFLISVILVAFTHFAGHELYRSGKIKHARQDWVESGRKGKTNTGTVPLASRQTVDDDQPGYVQLMNRVGTQPGYWVSIGSAIIVVIIAIFATYVRGQVLEKQLHQQVTSQAGNGPEFSAKPTQDGLDMAVKNTPQGIKLPAADAAENQRAGDKAAADDIDIDRHGGWGTFIVLAFIFVFLQILGVLFGFRWGFAGNDSHDAFRSIGAGRYSSYADVREHYKDIADTAQSKLEHLQQKLMNRNSISGNDGAHTTKTFYDFMDGERMRETADRAKELDHATQRGRMEKAQAMNKANATAPSPQPIQAAGPSPQGAQPVAAAIASGTGASLIEALQQLAYLGDNKDAKKAYIRGLSEDLQAQVMKALKVKKEEEVRLASQRDAELNDLL
jgi:hypothetical protein